MTRTPLLRALRALHLAHRRARLTGEPVTVSSLTGRVTRRRILQGGAALGLAPLLPLTTTACAEPPPGAAASTVGVVGAGIAGLHCAALLNSAGISVQVFDAQDRVGGRMFTDRATFAAQSGQHCELGGELIDTDHETMIALADAFGHELHDFDTDDASLATIVAHFDGQAVDVADLLASYGPVAAQLDSDVSAADTDDEAFARLDALSIVDWLDELADAGVLAADDPLRALLEVAYVIEYGLEAAEQSALNLIYLAGTSTTSLELFGASDERFHIKDGNDSVTTSLAGLLEGKLSLSHKLTKVTAQADGKVALSFDGQADAVFDRVVLALPFTLLREVDLSEAGFSDDKLACIAELGYGTNSKVMVGFSEKVWRTAHQSNGESFSDLGYQASWETSRLQPGDEGIITHFTGGQAGVDVGEGTPESQVATFLDRFDVVFPGAKAAHNGRVARFFWPGNAFMKASYTCYRPGQWTAFFGTEGLPEGSVHFCGEHTSADYQGFMEGGALTGAIAAAEVAEAVGVTLGEIDGALVVETPWARITRRAAEARRRRDALAVRAARRRARRAAP